MCVSPKVPYRFLVSTGKIHIHKQIPSWIEVLLHHLSVSGEHRDQEEGPTQYHLQLRSCHHPHRDPRDIHHSSGDMNFILNYQLLIMT